MSLHRSPLVVAVCASLALLGCMREDVREPVPDTTESTEAATATQPDARTALLPAASGCAPGARCLSVTSSGRPSASGTYVAQCRGRFADFIVPKATLPDDYDGPWFQPSLL